jgi:RHS repeat-associated protein
MITAHIPVRTLLSHGLLGLFLALPPAASAATSSGSLLPGSSQQSLPQSSASDSNCLSIDGGDPAVAHPCGEQAPASQDRPDGVAHGAGNPINVITGNKYQRETDLPALPGVLGIEIVRHYNSAQAGTDAPLGLLGRGWRLSYETDLYASGQQLHIVQADGTRLVFAADRTDATRHRHADPARGWVQVIAARTGRRAGGYRWAWPDGRTLDFDARGKLVQIRMPTGEFLSLARGLYGELLKVTDPQGRSLSFEYAPRSSRGFRGVVAITSPLGRFTYAHQNERALPGLSNLVAAAHPNGTVRRYHYGADAGESAPVWPHHLTGISLTARAATRTEEEPGGRRLSTYAYDRAGRAIMSVRGAPRAVDESGQPRPGTGIEQLDLDFAAPDRTVLSNSLGQRTIYRHTRIHGEPRLLEAIGPGCARCGETNVRYQYDARGRLLRSTRLDPAGQPLVATSLARDDAGRVLRESLQAFVDGKPLAERLLARYEYADDTSHPVLVARPSVVPGREHRLQFAHNDMGQITRIVETGFSPLDANGEPIDDPSRATPIERSSSFTYTRINGRSLLIASDGPLPNGRAGSPADSDISRFEWDAQGNHLTAITLPGDRRSTLEHDPVTGVLNGIRNEEGFATRYTYNLRLQPTTLRHEGPGLAAAHEQHIDYDALGRPVESRHPSSPASNWLQAWDEHGRLRWRARAIGILDTFRRDTEGRPVERSRRSARFEQAETLRYDAQGRLVSVRDNAGRGRDWRYDARGRLQYAIDSDGLIHPARTQAAPRAEDTAPSLPIRQLHDDFGRIVWRRSPDSGTVVHDYDAFDRLVAMRDARGNHARYDYDARGRIQRQRITDASSGAMEETQWRYEGRRLVELNHPTQRERYEYDAHGLRSARIITLPTERGELTTITRYEYDDRGQLVATTLPDGSRLRSVRNGQGQVVALTRDRGSGPWSRSLAGEQVIAEGFERDLAGLRSHVSGNGIHTLYQRSREGVLARIVHRRAARQGLETAATSPMELLGRSTREIAERLLGITPAHAQADDSAAGASREFIDKHAERATLPGALGLDDDPAALLDHRYLWDVRGNLLHSRQRAAADGARQTASGHAYDRHARLLSTVRWQTDDHAPAEEAVWRFAYDATQRRILSQQGVRSQQALSADTQAARFEPGTHRRVAPSAPVRYTASGQPERWGEREYDWDARGRLVEVREHGSVLARYRYDHRGLRNTRQVSERTIHTIYDEHRQPLAELDADGRILRQYVWLADLPLAVIDTPQGVAPAKPDQSVTAQFAGELFRMFRAGFTQPERIVWLHGNHLGAPELATDANGQVIWRATYAPFGAATIQSRDFTLDLRLPGQVFDAETGLHYNRARYYDPEAGQYLTPDPLGTPDGPNPYAYVAFNPLGNVDPDGLILFAFDGTDNSDDPTWLSEKGSTVSNVVFFRRAYDDGPTRYVTGVGTDHAERDTYGDIISRTYDAGLVPDRGGNYSGPDRIRRMFLYLNDEAERLDDDRVMDVDIIGFSRGAAQARDFANRLVSATRDGWYRYFKHDRDGSLQMKDSGPVTACQRVNFRFMGLFDTVLSTNRSDVAYNLSIPAAFAYVAQAVALNEYRSAPAGLDAFWTAPANFLFWDDTRVHLKNDDHYGGFQLESIGASTNQVGQVRIERGFIGAHADIGGGYGDNDGLSTVALNWMVAQAQIAGVAMDLKQLRPIDMGNPLIHDQSNVIRFGDPRGAPQEFQVIEAGRPRQVIRPYPLEDRPVAGGLGGGTQRTQTFARPEAGGHRSMVNAETHQFISYLPRRPDNVETFTVPTNSIEGLQGVPMNRTASNATGTVDMVRYLNWLREHGYAFAGDDRSE